MKTPRRTSGNRAKTSRDYKQGEQSAVAERPIGVVSPLEAVLLRPTRCFCCCRVIA